MGEEESKFLGGIEFSSGTHVLEIYEHGPFQVKLANTDTGASYQSIIIDNQSLRLLGNLFLEIAAKRTIR